MPPHSRTGGPRRGAKAAATLALSRLSGPVPESQAVRLTSRIRHARMPAACACCLRGPFRPHLPWAEGARVRIAPRNYRLEEAMVILADWRFAHARPFMSVARGPEGVSLDASSPRTNSVPSGQSGFLGSFGLPRIHPFRPSRSVRQYFVRQDEVSLSCSSPCRWPPAPWAL